MTRIVPVSGTTSSAILKFYNYDYNFIKSQKEFLGEGFLARECISAEIRSTNFIFFLFSIFIFFINNKIIFKRVFISVF